jgi:hypothetical protein
MLLVGEEIGEMFPSELDAIFEYPKLEETHLARLDLAIKTANVKPLTKGGIKGSIACVLDATDWVFSLSPSPEIQHCAFLIELCSAPFQIIVARCTCANNMFHPFYG